MDMSPSNLAKKDKLLRGQFFQHFTHGFLYESLAESFFVLEVKVKLFIGASKLAQLRS
jgi:hypothetical protein